MNIKEFERNPFDRIRFARIIKLILTEQDLIDNPGLDKRSLGTAFIEYIDSSGQGQIPAVLSFPSFSNPILDPKDQLDPEAGTANAGSCYGFVGIPSIGDLVILGFRLSGHPVVLGYCPQSFFQQFSESLNKADSWGTFRQLVSGEYSWKSKQQFEVYLDRGGAAHFRFLKQPSGVGTPPIDTTVDPSKEASPLLGELSLGTTYNSTFTTPVTLTSTGRPVIVSLNLPNSGKLQIDDQGNWEVTPKTAFKLQVDVGSTIDLPSSGSIAINNVSGQKVSIGTTGGPFQPVPAGTDLLTALNNLITQLNTFVTTVYNLHMHPTAALGSPSVPTVTGSAFSSISSSVLSQTVEVSK